jgi:CubicO group peptidase (beta-lactamase class C family)
MSSQPGKFWKKALAATAMLLIVTVLALSWLHRREIARALFVMQLFDGSSKADASSHMDRYFRLHVAHRAGAEAVLSAASAPMALPAQYAWNGQQLATEALLTSTDTTGLLVLKNGQIVQERYAAGLEPSTRWMGWTLGQPVVGSLIGLALQEGFIDSIDDPLTQYAPELAGTAYDGVTIRHALRMRSGVVWSERYDDSSSEVMRFVRAFASGTSLEDFARTLRRDQRPGVVQRTNSFDVQVLGRVLENATDRSLSTYLEQRLWSHLGASSDAHWLIDDNGRELAAGGLNLTLRDWARFGQLQLQNGRWQGQELLPRDWVALSHRGSGSPADRGLLWQLPEGGQHIDSPYVAIGLYNQFLYIDPARQVVIVKLSSNRHFAAAGDRPDHREAETLAWLKAVAEATDR